MYPEELTNDWRQRAVNTCNVAAQETYLRCADALEQAMKYPKPLPVEEDLGDSARPMGKIELAPKKLNVTIENIKLDCNAAGWGSFTVNGKELDIIGVEIKVKALEPPIVIAQLAPRVPCINPLDHEQSK